MTAVMKNVSAKKFSCGRFSHSDCCVYFDYISVIYFKYVYKNLDIHYFRRIDGDDCGQFLNKNHLIKIFCFITLMTMEPRYGPKYFLTS